MYQSENYRLCADDADFNNIASTSAIFRHIQDSANSHMEACGKTYRELWESGLAFVLSKITVKFYDVIKVHDRFTCTTWASPSKGVKFNRCYRVTKGDTCIAEAESVWALLNTNEDRLCKVGEHGFDLGEEDALHLETSPRFKIPAEAELASKGLREVMYSDIDMNGHMNNTKYPDVICNYVGDMTAKRVKEITINFVSPALTGEKIEFFAGEYKGKHYVRSVRPNGKVNIEAEIILGGI